MGLSRAGVGAGGRIWGRRGGRKSPRRPGQGRGGGVFAPNRQPCRRLIHPVGLLGQGLVEPAHQPQVTKGIPQIVGPAAVHLLAHQDQVAAAPGQKVDPGQNFGLGIPGGPAGGLSRSVGAEQLVGRQGADAFQQNEAARGEGVGPKAGKAQGNFQGGVAVLCPALPVAQDAGPTLLVPGREGGQIHPGAGLASGQGLGQLAFAAGRAADEKGEHGGLLVGGDMGGCGARGKTPGPLAGRGWGAGFQDWGV